ncbi:hypothetical protein HEB94_009317 [Actinopolymorpha pittospori]|uniref:Uncharacterized protein n=1 Tax=Actinopolymorpha pittospori TaxID=648752 RepID=A0A927RER1_9ACTN|nr:hypothetical protein [Actinopolymorpha pittospori]
MNALAAGLACKNISNDGIGATTYGVIFRTDPTDR